MSYTVMVIDDDQPTLEVMNLVLQKIGYIPLLSQNGLDALDKLKYERPDLILLDLQMMPIDGWEFLRKLKREQSLKDIPVMLFTARPLINEERQWAEKMTVKVLEKPVTPAELRSELLEFFRRT